MYYPPRSPSPESPHSIFYANSKSPPPALTKALIVSARFLLTIRTLKSAKKAAPPTTAPPTPSPAVVVFPAVFVVVPDLQVALPAELLLPAAQATQLALLACRLASVPASVKYVPAPHRTQDDVPVADVYFPAAQTLQTEEPGFAENVPRGQTRQEDEVVELVRPLYVPEAHFVQYGEPATAYVPLVQALHNVLDVLAELGDDVPAGQALQASDVVEPARGL